MPGGASYRSRYLLWREGDVTAFWKRRMGDRCPHVGWGEGNSLDSMLDCFSELYTSWLLVIPTFWPFWGNSWRPSPLLSSVLVPPPWFSFWTSSSTSLCWFDPLTLSVLWCFTYVYLRCCWHLQVQSISQLLSFIRTILCDLLYLVF